MGYAELIERLQALPQDKQAEVFDFVEFLAVRESRTAAGERLGMALAKLDAANLPPLSDADIAAEIAAARQERSVRRA